MQEGAYSSTGHALSTCALRSCVGLAVWCPASGSIGLAHVSPFCSSSDSLDMDGVYMGQVLPLLAAVRQQHESVVVVLGWGYSTENNMAAQLEAQLRSSATGVTVCTTPTFRRYSYGAAVTHQGSMHVQLSEDRSSLIISERTRWGELLDSPFPPVFMDNISFTYGGDRWLLLRAYNQVLDLDLHRSTLISNFAEPPSMSGLLLDVDRGGVVVSQRRAVFARLYASMCLQVALGGHSAYTQNRRRFELTLRGADTHTYRGDLSLLIDGVTVFARVHQ